MKNTLESRLGMFFVVIVLAGAFALEMTGVNWFRKGFPLKARFSDVFELHPGDLVKVGGVEVGKVQAIELDGGKVEVRLRMNKSANIPTDSTATVRFAGLMGQNFIAIELGGAASKLGTGDIIRTVEQADLNAIMRRLDNVTSGIENITKSFSGDTIQNIAGPLVDFFKQNNPRFNDIFENLRIASAQIAGGKGTVGKFIMEDSLHSNLLHTASSFGKASDEAQTFLASAKTLPADVKTLLGNAKTAFDQIGNTFTDARKALVNLDESFTQARQLIEGVNKGQGSLGKLVKDESLYKETATSMGSLREILDKINRGYGTMGKLVNDETLYKNLRTTLQKVDKATDGIEDQGPLSVIGLLFNGLF
ncbi:MAG: MCE family protein [Pedosphaera sp.]|nr:MCE family protein [Pedosphaera sp.]